MAGWQGGEETLHRSVRFPVLLASLWFACLVPALADGSLDGRVFTGLIGPAENPDLADSLYFSDGHFWSDICTRCGFVPGLYSAHEVDGGIRFTGVLESDSRGRFEYDGFVDEAGQIEVVIRWERKRWYWTSRRDIAFRGADASTGSPATLTQILLKMDGMNPEENALCARF